MNKRMTSEDVAELITRRRRQVLVHSVIYYRWNDSVIDDHTFDRWSKELADLQTQYPDIAKECEWHEAFAYFDGSSGYDLPLNDPHALNMAGRVLNAVRYIKQT